LDLAWKLLRIFPADQLKKISTDVIKDYYLRDPSKLGGEEKVEKKEKKEK
jgi:hypothetical protein